MNIKNSDIDQKRAMLSAIRLRFSPETQQIRETAIDKIIEQNMYIAFNGKTGSLKHLQEFGIPKLSSGRSIIDKKALEASLERLSRNGRVKEALIHGTKTYNLSQNALKEIGCLVGEAENRFIKILKQLLGDKFKTLEHLLIKCLSMVFSKLGESYVSIIKGEVSHREVITPDIINSAVDSLGEDIPEERDREEIAKATLQFFQTDDPEYNIIKWNMAQNYYIAKVIGLEPEDRILSRELFDNTILYLDTNILVSALEEEHEHHEGFKKMFLACQKLNISLKVCNISIDELRGFVNNQKNLLKKVVDQIPEETKNKISNVFLRLYEKKVAKNPQIDIDEVFLSFDMPIEKLSEKFNIKLDDDPWFDEANKDSEVINLSKELITRYEKIRGKEKHELSAITDAILLTWLKKCKEQTKHKIALVTLDTSLPGIFKHEEGLFVITLDTLLQWVSPLVNLQEKEEQDFARVFSEALKHQLLPRERIFQLQDFSIFADMQMSCKLMPAEDVEECIKAIKSTFPRLDPSRADDREKMAGAVAKFFADPGRKYQQELQRLKGEKENIQKKFEERIKFLEDQNEIIKNKQEKRIRNLEGQIKEIKKEAASKALRQSAYMRLAISLIFLAFLLFIICFWANRYGSGSNFFQKIINSWPLIPAGFVLWLVLAIFIVGKKRINALGWEFKKILFKQ